MRTAFTALVTLALTLAACGGPPNSPLAQVKPDDPVVPLNPNHWNAKVNNLIVPSGKSL